MATFTINNAILRKVYQNDPNTAQVLHWEAVFDIGTSQMIIIGRPSKADASLPGNAQHYAIPINHKYNITFTDLG